MIVEFPLLDVQETPTGPKGRVFVNPAHVKAVTAGIRRYPREEEATTDAFAAVNPHDYTCIFMAGDDGARWYIDMPIDQVVKELNDPAGVWFKQVSEALNQSMEATLTALAKALFPQPAIQGEPAVASASPAPDDRIFQTPEDVPNGIHHVVDKDGDYWTRCLGEPIADWYPADESGRFSRSFTTPQTDSMRNFGPFRKVTK